MYQEYFKLTDLPFENTPNPAFFYGGGQYRECLSAMLHYAANRRGIMSLSGPIGVGKTTLVHTLRRVLPDNTRVISLVHPESTPLELLTYVAQGLNLDAMPESRLQAVEVVRNELIRLDESGGVCLLIVDEAQLLTPELMEQIRLLSNLETEIHKLIQIILVGQPELVNLLNRQELAAVRQRISLMKILTALSPEESLYYIAHRLSRAGSGLELFSDQSLKTVIGYSGGIPRIINQLCEGALVSTFGAEREMVEVADVEEAAANLLLEGEKMLPSGFGAQVEPSPEQVPPSPPLEEETEPVFMEDWEEPVAEELPEREAVPEQETPPKEEPSSREVSEEAEQIEDNGVFLTPKPEERPVKTERTKLGELPQNLFYETESEDIPIHSSKTSEDKEPPSLIASIEDSQTIEEDPEQEQAAAEPTEEEGPAKMEWSPPPPEPAPQEKESRPSMFRPVVLLIIALLFLSASLGFYLALDKKSDPAPKRSTVTVPLKPGTNGSGGN